MDTVRKWGFDPLIGTVDAQAYLPAARKRDKDVVHKQLDILAEFDDVGRAAKHTLPMHAYRFRRITPNQQHI